MGDAPSGKISYQPTDGLSYDPSDPVCWDADALRKETLRVFEVCHGCRMCVGFCGSFPEMFERVDGYVAKRRGEIEAFDDVDAQLGNEAPQFKTSSEAVGGLLRFPIIEEPLQALGLLLGQSRHLRVIRLRDEFHSAFVLGNGPT